MKCLTSLLSVRLNLLLITNYMIIPILDKMFGRKENGTGPEKSDICFCVTFDRHCKSSICFEKNGH